MPNPKKKTLPISPNDLPYVGPVGSPDGPEVNRPDHVGGNSTLDQLLYDMGQISGNGGDFRPPPAPVTGGSGPSGGGGADTTPANPPSYQVPPIIPGDPIPQAPQTPGGGSVPDESGGGFGFDDLIGGAVGVFGDLNEWFQSPEGQATAQSVGNIVNTYINYDAVRDAAQIQADAADRDRRESLGFLTQNNNTARNDLRNNFGAARDNLQRGLDQGDRFISEGAQNFEDTVRGGVAGSQYANKLIYDSSRGELASGFDDARGNIGANADLANSLYGRQTDFQQKAHRNALAAATAAEGRARGDVTGGRDLALDQLEQGIAGAENDFRPYTSAGASASDLRAALTGALGPEAQAEAFANYQESPGQAYLREQDERAITRNAAATGGLRGGNVLEELGRRSTGRNNQRLDTDIGHLGNIAGLGAATAGDLARIRAGLRSTGAGIESTTGTNLANIGLRSEDTRQASRNRHRADRNASYDQLGNRLTNVNNNLADLDVAQTGAGIELTQRFGDTAIGLNNDLTNALGRNAVDTAGRRTDLLTNTQTNKANLNSALGTNLANVAVGQGSAGANIIGTSIQNGANADAYGRIGTAGALTGGINELGNILGDYLGRPKQETNTTGGVYNPGRYQIPPITPYDYGR